MPPVKLDELSKRQLRAKARAKLIRKELKNFTYLIGTTFGVDARVDGTYLIYMERPTSHDANTRRPAKNASLGMSMVVGDDYLFSNGKLRTSILKQQIMNLTRCLELHEMDEWLRYKGKSIHAPHPR